jgi:hypothetical protein
MPTGYTAAVQRGEIETLGQFAMHCARAFGACIMMRDDPTDAKIPERFEPDTKYYDDGISQAEAEIERLAGMTIQQCDDAALAEHAEKVAARAARETERESQRVRYQAMLDKVKRWRPHKDIDGLRTFMIEQLESSICHDCDGGYDKTPETPMGFVWRDARLAEARRSLAYFRTEREREVERVAGRNVWLAQLRADLLEVPE